MPIKQFARLTIVALAMVPFATCADFTGPSGRGVQVPIIPTFSPAATFAKALYASAGIDFDRVRIVIVRGNSEVLKDTTVSYSSESEELTLPLVIAANPGEVVSATVEYRNAEMVLYSGTASVTALAVGIPSESPPAPVVLVPVGPGSSAQSVQLSPTGGTFPTSVALLLSAQAIGSNGNAIPNALFGWSTDNPAVATVDAQGLVQPTTAGGVVKVRATTLNEKFAEATLTFVRVPASLVAQSGANQTAQALDQLPVPVVLKVADVNGNGVPGATVNFAIASGGGSIASINNVSDAAGLVSVNWTLGETVGAQSITATAVALPNAPLTISATATARPAKTLAFHQQPTTTPMRSPIAPGVSVKALDDKGRVVTGFTGAIAVAIETNPGNATLGGTLTMNAVAGVATFSDLTVSAAGAGYSLKATSGTLTPAVSSTFKVDQVASTLTLAGGGGQTAVIRSLLSPISVKVSDANGIGVAGVTVGFEVVSGAGTLVVENAVTDASGLAIVKWTLGSLVGTQSIRASAAGLTGSPLVIEAQAAPLPPIALAFLQQPPSAVAMGTTIGPAVSVRAIDADGQTVSGFTGAVTLALDANPGSATLGGTLTVNAVAGVATFSNLTVSHAAQGYTVKASASGFANITSTSFNVSAVASALTLSSGSGQSATIASTLSPIIVKVADANGLGVAGISVSFAVVTGGGTVNVASANTDASGLASVVWTLGSAVGTQSIKAVVTGLTGSPLIIEAQATALPPTALAFSQQPSAVAMGATMSPAVSVRAIDADGQTVSGFTGAVTLALDANPGSATLGGTLTVNAVAGVATFSNLTVSHAAQGYTLKASASGFTNVNSTSFNVAAVASTLTLSSGNGQSATIGSALSPIIVKVADANGLGVAGISVSFEVVTGGGTVNVSSANTDASGFASVVWTLGNVVGAQSMSAAVSGLAGSPVAIEAQGTALPAVSLAFLQGPTNAVSNATISPPITVRALDIAGNVVPSFTGTIALTLENNTGGGSLAGTVSVAAVSGVATFSNLSVNVAASGYALKATAPGDLSVTSGTFDVTAPVPVALVFQQQPSNVQVGTTMTPPIKVRIVDANGVTVPGATHTVTLFQEPGLLDVAKSGNVATAVDGVATFDSFQMSGFVGTLQVKASAAGLTSVVSNAFSLTTPPAENRLWVGGSSTSWHDAANWSPAGVPAAIDSVTIVSATNQPLITTFANARVIVVAVGATLNINTNSGLFTDKLVNRGTLNVTSAVISGDVENRGTMVVNGFMSMNNLLTTSTGITTVTGSVANGGEIFANQSFINEGQVQMTDSDGSYADLYATDSLVNRSGATISVLQGVGGDRSISAVLRNYGAINVATSSGLYLYQGATGAINSGSITLTGGGNLYQYAGDSTHTFVNTGTMALGAGVWELLDANFKSTGAGTVGGTGMLRTFYSQVDVDFTKFSRSLRVDADTRFAGATVSIPAGTTVKVLSGEFTQPVAVAGTLDLTDITYAGDRIFAGGMSIASTGTVLAASDVQVDAAFSIAAGGTLRSTATGAAREFDVNVPFTNQGTIELSSAGSALLSRLSVSGTLTNAAGATITAKNGAGGERRIVAILNNLGTVTVESSTFLSLATGASTHTNSGTITLLDGTAGTVDANNKSLNLLGFESASTLNNAGTISIGANRAVYVDVAYANTLVNQAAGIVSGTGKLSVPTGAVFTNSGTLRPAGAGVVGTMTFEGNFALGTGTVEIDAATMVSGDRLTVTGVATLGSGTVKVIPAAGFVVGGGSLHVITAASCIGTPSFQPVGVWGGYNDGCIYVYPVIIGNLMPNLPD